MPLAVRRKILDIHHDHVLAGHMGVRGTMAKIRENLWWPAMKKDVTKYVRSCDACQRGKRTIRKQPGLLRPIPVPGTPGEYLSWDVTGPFITTPGGNKYVIMAICLLSKFVIAKPIVDASAESVVRFFLENIVAVFGSPKFILSDCGGCFLAGKTRAVLQSVGCKLLKTSAYAPTTNGLIEKQFFLLKQCLRIYLQQTPQYRWDQYLGYLIFAMNTTEKPSTGFTPYELVFVKKPPRNFISCENTNENTMRIMDQAQMFRKQAWESIQYAQEVYKKRADIKREDVSLEEGNLVLVFNPSTPVGLNPKLTVHWSGPWLVLKMMSPNTVLISRIDIPSKQKVINVRRVKPYYTRAELEKEVERETQESSNQQAVKLEQFSDEDSEYESAEEGSEESSTKKGNDSSAVMQEEDHINISEYGSEEEMDETNAENSNPPAVGSLYRTRYGRPIRPPDR